MRISFFIGIAVCHLVLGSCATLPAMQEATGRIPVREIVLRIKCELSDAFKASDQGWLLNQPKFEWLKKWTAQVDLTLQILDTATLSPGATLTQPFRNGYAVASGPNTISTSGVLGSTIAAVPQSFAIAGGASINGQASRIETLSFAMSLEELERWRKEPNTSELCAISDNMDLRGRLGLKEWVAEALSPVAREGEELPEYLYAGYHPKPGAAAEKPKNSTPPSKPVPLFALPAPPSCETLPQAESLLAVAKKKIDNAETDFANQINIVKEAEDSAQKARKKAASTLAILLKAEKTLIANYKEFDSVLEPYIKGQEDSHLTSISAAKNINSKIAENIAHVTAAASGASKPFDDAKDAYKIAEASIKEAEKAADSEKAEKIRKACEAVTKANQWADALAHNPEVVMNAKLAKQNADITEDNLKLFSTVTNTENDYVSHLKPVDPPISSIGQSVQFILNYQGNVSPTWTFVRFKGPNNPLFAAGRTRTHMLSITLGPVTPGTSNTPNSNVTQNQLYLLLNNLLPPPPR